MRRRLLAMIGALLVLSSAATWSQVAWNAVFCNGRLYDGPRYAELDTIYMPLAKYATMLGLKLHNEGPVYCLTDVYTGDKNCPVKSGQPGLYVDGVFLDGVLTLKDDFAYVNAKKLTEVLGGRYIPDLSGGSVTMFLSAGPHRPHIAGAAPIYIDGRQYQGVTDGQGENVQVNAYEFAQAMGVSCNTNGGVLVMNGAKITDAKAVDKGFMVPLISCAGRIGAHAALGDENRVDVHTSRGMVPPEVEKAILNDPQITSELEMNFLYGIVLDAYEAEGLKIYHPIRTNWVTLQALQSHTSRDTYGLTTAQTYGYEGTLAGIEYIEMFIPYGLSPEQTLHVLAHELGHGWQFDNGLVDAGPIYTEGFAEWVASRVLHRLKLTHEIDVMKFNAYTQYSDGFKLFLDIETQNGGVATSRGRDACLAEMKRRGAPGANPFKN